MLLIPAVWSDYNCQAWTVGRKEGNYWHKDQRVCNCREYAGT